MTVIVTKNSSTANDVPTTSDLVQGELAVNVTDKRIYTENASTAIVELGTNPSSITTPTVTVTGTLTANGTLASSNAVITGGSVNGIIIGASSPLAITGSVITANTGFAGSLTGAVAGNLTGNVSGNVTGNVTGNLTGNVNATSGTTSLHNLALTGTVDFNAARLTDIGTPQAATDAVTKGYADGLITSLIAGAPAALDTLNELAAALDDDAAFHTTVTNSIATKLPLAGGTMSGQLSLGSNKIASLANPTNAQDAATKAYVDAADTTGLPLAGGTMSGAIAMGNNKITGLATPTAAADSTTKGYVDGILGSATSAATSASAAATSASNASTSASGAATSATASGNSASASASSAAAAATTYDNFDDRYLGDKSSDPTVDNDGNALLTGALYFNTTSDSMKVYSGSSWSAVAPTATSINLASQVTGTLPSSNGGTGLTAVGTSGNVLKSNGSVWVSAPEQSDAGGTVTSIGVAGGTTGLTTSGGPITTSGNITLAGTLVPANGGTGVTSKTGTGSVVLNTTPTLTTPVLSGITTTASGSMEFAPANYTMVVRGGGSDEGSITLNCAANSHGQTITSQPHSAAATNTMLLPEGADSTLLSRVSTDTLTNKTWNSNAIGRAYGGTGLTAAGTSGNVLTSDGTNWASTPPAGGGGNEMDFVASGAIANGVGVGLNSNGTISQVSASGFPTQLGNESTFYNNASNGGGHAAYDPVNEKVCIAYTDANNYPSCVMGSVSGATFSWGTPVIMSTMGHHSDSLYVAYSTVNNCFIFIYSSVDGSGYGKLILRQSAPANYATNNIAVYGEVIRFSDLYSQYAPARIEWDPVLNRVIYMYRQEYPYYTLYIASSAPTAGTSGNFTNQSAGQIGTQGAANYPQSMVYNPSTNKTVVAYNRGGVGYFASVTNSSSQAPTVSSEYQASNVSTNGLYSMVYAGTASTGTVMVSYNDSSSSNIAKFFTLNWGGSSFTNTTPISMAGLTSSAVYGIFMAYNSTDDSIGVVTKVTTSNTNIGKFTTATVSGTTISFSGSITDIKSTAIQTPEMAWDSTSNKYLMSYADAAGNQHNHMKTVVGASSNNIDFIGISAASISNGATGTVALRGGVAENLSSLTPNASYYVSASGVIGSSSTAQKAGKALTSTKLLITGLT